MSNDIGKLRNALVLLQDSELVMNVLSISSTPKCIFSDKRGNIKLYLIRSRGYWLPEEQGESRKDIQKWLERCIVDNSKFFDYSIFITPSHIYDELVGTIKKTQ